MFLKIEDHIWINADEILEIRRIELAGKTKITMKNDTVYLVSKTIEEIIGVK